jgi:hypothetical protein
MQIGPLRLYDRGRLLDNYRIKFFNSIYENLKPSRVLAPRV